ncbi:ATP-binding cassette domain-containing protein [Thiohalobacter sp. IOR34]|uniref:ATP-binding cassette domain-containing protein n=1 Tax=Thiohalobacter sp. IOR34 TaxID=3057176 RepID=UPI0025AF7DA2|nr:ATP-binding cassette domain-containing protein [Thiohalobacter sp. IOR34]WJW75413.1 ATP-binding cassette domain-containing protein [Thiohalobacter sp. IOR34]
MLELHHLSLRRGPRLLLSDVSLRIHPGQRVGLTGRNGTGKSSLFALIRGELQPDAGDCRLPAGWVIASVRQETPAVDTPAIDYVLEGDTEWTHLSHALEDTSLEGGRLAELHARYEAIDGYSARSRAAQLLAGLGFAETQHGQPVGSFSGGWRMRLNLAQALMCRSDLLLLDEPTNHLDLDAVLWLEDWLRRYSGTLLLISHDRDVLDRVVNAIAHIEHQGIELYRGGYSDFEAARAERLAQQQAAFERQQREVAQVQQFIARFRAKASKARQAQSRLKALARLEKISAAHIDSPFRFRFQGAGRPPNPLLRLEDAAAGYADQPVLEGLNLSLGPGNRLGLLGRNGAGKSTLTRLLAGELVPLAGQRIAAPELRVGYFAQHQLEQLRPELSPVEHLQRLDPAAGEQALRDFLGGFGFSGEQALAPVAPFSGGEKARLVLALLVYQRPNLLLLDEPTNHLDLEMRLALELALQDFEGALVVVSHDRHLLRTVCDQLLLVDDGHATPFDGDLDDYRDWLAGSRPASAVSRTPASSPGGSRREQRRAEAERRQRLAPLNRELKQLEAEMEALGRQRETLEARLADPELYAEAAKAELQQLLLDKADNDRRLAAAEARWLELSEMLETAE